jgi:hypothetical protein
MVSALPHWIMRMRKLRNSFRIPETSNSYKSMMLKSRWLPIGAVMIHAGAPSPLPQSCILYMPELFVTTCHDARRQMSVPESSQRCLFQNIETCTIDIQYFYAHFQCTVLRAALGTRFTQPCLVNVNSTKRRSGDTRNAESYLRHGTG